MFLPYEAAAAICGTKQPPPSHRATHNPLYLHPPPGLPFSVILKPLIGNVNIFPPSSLLLFFCNLYMRLTLKKRGREATFSIKLNMGVFCSFLSRDFTAFEFLSIAYTSFSLPFYQPLFLLDAIFFPFLSLTHSSCLLLQFYYKLHSFTWQFSARVWTERWGVFLRKDSGTLEAIQKPTKRQKNCLQSVFTLFANTR